MVKYIEVDQREIRQEKVEAALRMMAYACNELKIPAPEVKWFAPADNPFNFKAIGEFTHDKGLLGLADPEGLLEHGGTILIRADLPVEETAETVAHEVLHVMQFYTLALKYYDMIDTEKLADEFAGEISSEAYLKDNKSYLDYLTGKDFSAGRFKNKELAESWRRCARDEQRRRRAASGGRRREAEDITQQDWFKEAARREAEALRYLERQGMTLRDVP